MLSIGKILITIQALLDDNPIANEPAFYGCKKNSPEASEYALMSRLLTLHSVPLMLARKDLPDEFMAVMHDYVEKNKELYESSIAILDNYKGEKVNTIHGNYTISKYNFLS